MNDERLNMCFEQKTSGAPNAVRLIDRTVRKATSGKRCLSEWAKPSLLPFF
jgi:hypothetical protein